MREASRVFLGIVKVATYFGAIVGGIMFGVIAAAILVPSILVAFMAACIEGAWEWSKAKAQLMRAEPFREKESESVIATQGAKEN